MNPILNTLKYKAGIHFMGSLWISQNAITTYGSIDL